MYAFKNRQQEQKKTIDIHESYFVIQYAVLKVTEFLMGLVCWALFVSKPYSTYNLLSLVLFVSITAWVATTLSGIAYFITMYLRPHGITPWDVIEFIFNLIWCVLYFIASCASIASAGEYVNWTAATVIAWLLTFVYTGHMMYAAWRWKNSWMWEVFNTSVAAYAVTT